MDIQRSGPELFDPEIASQDRSTLLLYCTGNLSRMTVLKLLLILSPCGRFLLGNLSMDRFRGNGNFSG